MGAIAKLTPEVEAALPAELKADLGLRGGDALEFTKVPDGSWRVARARRRSFDDIAGMLVADRAVSDEELAQAVEEARASMALGDGRD